MRPRRSKTFTALVLLALVLLMGSHHKAQAELGSTTNDCTDAIAYWAGMATIAAAAWSETGGSFGLMSGAAVVASVESATAFEDMIEACGFYFTNVQTTTMTCVAGLGCR